MSRTTQVYGLLLYLLTLPYTKNRLLKPHTSVECQNDEPHTRQHSRSNATLWKWLVVLSGVAATTSLLHFNFVPMECLCLSLWVIIEIILENIILVIICRCWPYDLTIRWGWGGKEWGLVKSSQKINFPVHYSCKICIK